MADELVKDPQDSLNDEEKNKGKKTSKQVVEVPVDVWNLILANQNDIKDKLGMLEFAADRGRIAKYQDQHRDMTEKIARVTTIDGQIVTRWTDLAPKDNIVAKTPQGGWLENQVVTFMFEGEEEPRHRLAYNEFVRKTVWVEGTIESRTTSSDGSEVFILNVDGKKIEIDSRFVN
jgi:hypothetical protein